MSVNNVIRMSRCARAVALESAKGAQVTIARGNKSTGNDALARSSGDADANSHLLSRLLDVAGHGVSRHLTGMGPGVSRTILQYVVSGGSGQ